MNENGAVLALSEALMMYNYISDKENLGYHKVVKSRDKLQSIYVCVRLRRDFPWKLKMDRVIRFVICVPKRFLSECAF